MTARNHRSSPEEIARRGDEIYERNIRAQIEAQYHGKIVAIDVDTAAYVVDDNAIDAARRLRAKHPEAEVWLVRIGHRTLHHIGVRPNAGQV